MVAVATHGSHHIKALTNEERENKKPTKLQGNNTGKRDDANQMAPDTRI